MNKYLILALMLFSSASMAQRNPDPNATVTVSRYPEYQRVYEAEGRTCEDVEAQQQYRSRTWEVVVGSAIDEALIRVNPNLRPVAAAGVADANAQRIAGQDSRYRAKCEAARSSGYYREVLTGYRIVYRYPNGSTRERFEPIR